MTAGPDGLLLVDKPAGPTSHDVVARVRRALGCTRVGHAGTLDPAASGLLPLLLGSATRLARFLPKDPKTYAGRLRLGIVTSTDDAQGAVRHRHEGALPSAETVLRAASRLQGPLDQVPPAVSAKKVGGQRMYVLARRGVTIAAPPVAVEIFRFTLVPEDPAAGIYRFEAEVSTGTYVRALARDLGAALECGGSLLDLRRIRIGPWRVEHALALPAGDPPAPEGLREAILAPEAIPLLVPSVRLEDAESVRRFRSGNPVRIDVASASGALGVLAPDGRLLGIADWAPPCVVPRVVLPFREP